ncbi:MAG TPA: RDD family protein [Rhodanobacteraceae bacterium]|nr:RDD family protein [Rhodanobacteraceae bacterium]
MRTARVDRELPASVNDPVLHAGFWRRVAAYVLDALLLMVVGFVVGIVFGVVEFLVIHKTSRAAGYALGIVVAWQYFAWFESSAKQATPGKLALGLCVTDMRGARIGFWRATGRYFGKFISILILFVGFMMAGWTRRKQALHDMMAGCCVVRREGLERFERGEAFVPGVRASGMPVWAIALIVVFGGLFLMVPILAAISIPAYQNYLVRSQVNEGMVLATGAKAGIAEYFSRYGRFPGSNADAGVASPASITSEYVSSVRVGVLDAQHGMVVVGFSDNAPQRSDAALDGKYLVLVAHAGLGGTLDWKCVSNVPAKDLISTCRHLPDR